MDSLKWRKKIQTFVSLFTKKAKTLRVVCCQSLLLFNSTKTITSAAMLYHRNNVCAFIFIWNEDKSDVVPRCVSVVIPMNSKIKLKIYFSRFKAKLCANQYDCKMEILRTSWIIHTNLNIHSMESIFTIWHNSYFHMTIEISNIMFMVFVFNKTYYLYC